MTSILQPKKQKIQRSAMNPQCTNQDQPYMCVCFFFFSTILFFLKSQIWLKGLPWQFGSKWSEDFDDIIYSRKNASIIKNFTTFVIICHMISCSGEGLDPHKPTIFIHHSQLVICWIVKKVMKFVMVLTLFPLKQSIFVKIGY